MTESNLLAAVKDLDGFKADIDPRLEVFQNLYSTLQTCRNRDEAMLAFQVADLTFEDMNFIDSKWLDGLVSIITGHVISNNSRGRVMFEERSAPVIPLHVDVLTYAITRDIITTDSVIDVLIDRHGGFNVAINVLEQLGESWHVSFMNACKLARLDRSDTKSPTSKLICEGIELVCKYANYPENRVSAVSVLLSDLSYLMGDVIDQLLTALHYSIRARHIELTMILLSQQAADCKAWVIAEETLQIDLFEAFYASGFYHTRRYSHDAMRIVYSEYMVEAHAKAATRFLLQKLHRHRWADLHVSPVKRGDVEAICMLVDLGVFPDSLAVEAAFQSNYTYDMLKLIFEKADKRIRVSRERIQEALHCNNPNVLDLILQPKYLTGGDYALFAVVACTEMKWELANLWIEKANFPCDVFYDVIREMQRIESVEWLLNHPNPVYLSKWTNPTQCLRNALWARWLVAIRYGETKMLEWLRKSPMEVPNVSV